jgi:hypothetical protein
MSLVRGNPNAPKGEASAPMQFYTQRTRAALSAVWDGVTGNIRERARAMSARGRQLLSQLKNMSLHMSPKNT